MKHPLLLLVLLLFAGKILAQTPQIASVFPAGMSLTATTGTALTAIFNEPLDPASVNETTFRIFGKWSGPAKGDFTFSQNQTQVHFQPTEPFIAGETVLVQLSKGIKSAAGQAMEKPFAWSFAIATAPGTLHQKLKKNHPDVAGCPRRSSGEATQRIGCLRGAGGWFTHVKDIPNIRFESLPIAIGSVRQEI